MAFNVVGLTSLLHCSLGTVPTPLIVLPDQSVVMEGMLCGCITDNIPFANIPGYVLCLSLGNPAVAAATAADFGILTPMPCTPITLEPWISTCFDVIVRGGPVLDETALLICDYGGVITVIEPGNFTVVIP